MSPSGTVDVCGEQTTVLTEHGTTVLSVTHNVTMSERCDRTIEVIDGQIAGH